MPALFRWAPAGAGDIPQLPAETAGNVTLGWGKREKNSSQFQGPPEPTQWFSGPGKQAGEEPEQTAQAPWGKAQRCAPILHSGCWRGWVTRVPRCRGYTWAQPCPASPAPSWPLPDPAKEVAAAPAPALSTQSPPCQCSGGGMSTEGPHLVLL